MKKIAITLGDPTSIGPEIVHKALNTHDFGHNIIILYGAFPDKLKNNDLVRIKSPDEIQNITKNLFWIPISDECLFRSGDPSLESGRTAYLSIERAAIDAARGLVNAVVTAPVSKHYVQLSYPDFIGHTELLARISGASGVVMSFFSNKLKVGLLTTHCSLKEVASRISIQMINRKVAIIHEALAGAFKIKKPKLALLGLNPHAGERGAFGCEEQHIMIPALNDLKRKGIDISGPYPADTFFTGEYQKYDMIISAYHDQVLIPFKMLAFDEGVNVTLGLPFARTSVDHGTAFDIAGKDIASEKSLVAAIDLAISMCS